MTNKLTESEVIAFVTNAKKGAYHGVTYRNALTLNKCHQEHSLVAVSTYIGRFGVNYYNIASVAERIAENEPKKTNTGLSAEVQDIIYRNAKGEAIIRFAPNWSAKHTKVYILDGEEVSKEQLLQMGFSKSELHIKDGGTPPEVINLKASQIQELR